MDDLITCVRDILIDKFFVDPAALGPTTRFEDLDLDSLVLAELAVMLQGRLGVPVDDSDLAVTMTVADVATMLTAKGAPV